MQRGTDQKWLKNSIRESMEMVSVPVSVSGQLGGGANAGEGAAQTARTAQEMIEAVADVKRLRYSHAITSTSGPYLLHAHAAAPSQLPYNSYLRTPALQNPPTDT